MSHFFALSLESSSMTDLALPRRLRSPETPLRGWIMGHGPSHGGALPRERDMVVTAALTCLARCNSY